MSNGTNKGGAAFPWQEHNGDGSHYCDWQGMSLRDYFAAKATEEDVCFHMTHHPTGRGGYIQNSGTGVPNRSREQAKFQYADAMLAARGDA